MSKIWTICKREFASYFDSLIAYVMLIFFLGLSGYLTWLFGNNVFMIGQADLGVFFDFAAYWSLFLFIPAVTMRSLAEETKSGTIELLSTKAVSDWEIVVGKFSAALLLVIIGLLCTLPYYITVSFLGDVDHGGIIGGYFGLVFLSASYISIGIFASSLTSNQIVAFLLGLLIILFFHLIFMLLSFSFTGVVGGVFNFLSMKSHYDSISRGVFDSRDLIFFITIILLGLTMAQAMLSKRNWQA